MTKSDLARALVESLLSAGAQQTNSGAYELPLEGWLRQRETIVSIREKVGNRLRPFVWVTYSCARCQAPSRRTLAEADKKVRSGARMFCGHECAARAINAARGMVEQRACKVCGAPLSAAQKTTRVCSAECRAVTAKRRGETRSRSVGLPTRVCETCQSSFRLKARSIKGRFCSRACKDKGHAKDMTGEKNPVWCQDMVKRRLGATGFARLKPKVWARDGHCCVVCRAAFPDAVLDVHHINMDPADNRMENLVTLCHPCHMKLHGAERSKPKKILWPWLSEYAESASSTTLKSNKPTASLPMAS